MPDLGMKYTEQFARNKNRKLVQIFFYSELGKIQTILFFKSFVGVNEHDQQKRKYLILILSHLVLE